jgi:PAS domain S-box-containing protein
MIVEDEPQVASLIAHQLEKFGYTVSASVSTGEDGIKAAEDGRPDLVLMDIGLEGSVDGIEAATKIRFRLGIPVIYLTGDAEPATVGRAKLAEPVGYILKPFKPEELRTTIETALYQFHTIQRRASEALQQAELQYRLLFENALEGIYQSSPDGRFISANPAIARMLGYESPQELISKVTDIERQLHVRPERWRGFKRLLHEAGIARRFESRIRRRDGWEIWISENARAVYDESGHVDYYESFVEDITERKEVEQALRESEEYLNRIINCIGDPILVKDSQHRLILINDALCALAGKPREELLGKTDHDHYSKEQADIFWAQDDRVLDTGREQIVEDEIADAEGKSRTIMTRKSLLTDKAGNQQIVCVVRDITNRKQIEEQLRASENLYHSLVESLPQNVFRKDAEGRFTFANQRFCQTTGKRVEEVLGKTDFDFYPADLAAKYRRDDRRIMETGETFETVEEHQAPGQSRSYVRVIKVPLRNAQGKVNGIQAIFWDITEGKRAGDQLRKLSLAVEQSPASVVITDPEGTIEYVNRKFVDVTGYSTEEVIGKNPRLLKSGETPTHCYVEMWNTITSGREWRGEFHNRKKNGDLFWESATITPIKDQSGNTTHFVAIKEDITERKRTEQERDMMEIKLRQAMKLEAIGQLAAGIAHEINTPTQYVGDNTRFLQDAFGDLSKVLQSYKRLLAANNQGVADSELVAEVEASMREADLDYLVAEIPKAIAQSLEGVERVATIVRAMKEFSHPGGEEKQLTDLNHAIESTITVCRNEWKYVAEMAIDFDPELPPVPCHPGEFNQVILNLIINAAHSIADVVGKDNGKGTIAVRTRRESEWAEIRISDTGTGIPEEHRGKIFTPFFTTKEVGRGTGQGLAIAHSVVVGKHDGTIDFETEMGKGTTFTIRLPLDRTLS